MAFKSKESEKKNYTRAIVVVTKVIRDEPNYYMTKPLEADFLDENLPNHLYVRARHDVDLGKLVTKVMADFCPNAGIHIPKLDDDDYPNTRFEIGDVAYTVVPALLGVRHHDFHNHALVAVDGPIKHTDYCEVLAEDGTEHSKMLLNKLEVLRKYILTNGKKWGAAPLPNSYLL